MPYATPINVVALIFLLVATYLGWWWPWGLLFIFWAIPAVYYGEAHLIGPIPRDTQPLLFWAVTVLWILLGIMTVMMDLAPQTLDRLYLLMGGRG